MRKWSDTEVAYRGGDNMTINEKGKVPYRGEKRFGSGDEELSYCCYCY